MPLVTGVLANNQHHNKRYSLKLEEYDCFGKQLRLISIAHYNSRVVAVSNVQFQNYETEWSDVLPDSVGEMLLEKVCELF